MDCLVFVSKGYKPKFGPLEPLLHVEKFVVGGGGGWWVVYKVILVIILDPWSRLINCQTPNLTLTVWWV